ncbi:MAG: protein-glutamate O-methyltransferase CheR [Phycisphaerales bacterium]|nr:protein-glutamate O-methyltransferase CheR [Phycisphaerales bacterium]
MTAHPPAFNFTPAPKPVITPPPEAASGAPAIGLSGPKILMTDEQFDDLRKVVYARSGIHFPDGKKYVLESRLGQRLVELEMESYDQYLAFLTMGPYQADEFQEMFNRITINETSFFRNEPQLDVFERQCLPQLLEARKGCKRLRIWSAACSSGEEPFTLAIIVHRALGVRLPDWHIEILGTDISEKALSTAQRGCYTSYAIRTTSELIKKRYFKQVGLHFELDPTIRSMVSFEVHNLRERLAAKRHGTWDVIFCRNVMIYFDDAMKRQVVHTFGEVLANDGTLFIGHSETLRGLDAPFEVMPVAQGFCYRHINASSRAA